MNWKKKLRKLTLLSLGLLLVGNLGMSAPRAMAASVDPFAMAAQALGVYAAYQGALSSLLALGNDAESQILSRRQDIQANGLDENPYDQQVVDTVMHQLINKGSYVLKANSLPFMWAVNNRQEFNAACYPTNYVSVNRALVRGLQGDIDELAAVLGHEMTHGLYQHSAHNYAKAVAQYNGMMLLNMDTGSMDWNRLQRMATYSIANNVTMPTEAEADTGGFYLMTSAGFNPGGGAAAMARMGHYLTYETQNFLEQQPEYNASEKRAQRDESVSDHPETQDREQKLAQLMTDYGCGHVTVKDRKSIYIDGTKLLDVDWTSDTYDNTIENAYYVAGALAKAFHDYDSPAGWDFRQDARGTVTCLPDSRVYHTLQQFLQTSGAGARLQQLVTAAYAAEAKSGARQKMRAQEAQRAQELAQARENVLNAPLKYAKQFTSNADAYSDYGYSEPAFFELTRASLARNQEDPSLRYAIRARAKAVDGDFAAALQDSDKAVSMNSKEVLNYLNRADVYHMAGNLTAALADLDRAKQVKADNLYIYIIGGQIRDEQGDHKGALADYTELYRLQPRAFRRIPEEYLKDIPVAADDYKTYEKEKAAAKKKREEALKKEMKEQQDQKAQKAQKAQKQAVKK